MKEVALDKLAKEKGPSDLAAALGCSPSAITHAVQDCRDIRVKVYKGGRMEAYEIKPFPGKQKSPTAA